MLIGDKVINANNPVAAANADDKDDKYVDNKDNKKYDN